MTKGCGAKGRVALGVSGGRDSMVMLDMFLKSGGDFFVVTVNHGIRGEASKEDARFVEDYCRERGVLCKSFEVDAPAYARGRGIGLEQAARELRHSIFKTFIDIGEAKKIALAHHADDAAESVLMHILRGCGLDGLKGMSAEDGHIIRPLIEMSGAEIAAYAQKNGVPYREDATNADTAYSRNFLRLEVIPLIKRKYPSFERSLARLSDAAARTCEFLNGFSSEGIERRGDAVFIPCADLTRGDVIDDVNLKHALTLCGAATDFEAKHYAAVKGLCLSENGARVDLPNGFFAAKEYDFVAIRKNFDTNCDVREFKPGTIEFGDYEIRVERVEKPEKFGKIEPRVLYIDADRLPEGAVVRRVADGDKFRPYGGGTKSLGDYFTDKKIPLAERKKLPLIADGKRVLAVFGLEISEDVKCVAGSKNIYALELRGRKSDALFGDSYHRGGD